MKKRILAFVLAATMAIGMAGCGSKSADTAATTAEGGAQTASASSDLNVMIETPVESLDPQQATDGTSFEVIADYTDGLMQMDSDGNPVNAIAESYEVSEDGLTYTFKLRQDAKWSNGTAVTAADFVFAWQRAVDPEVASEYSYMLSDIGQIVNAEAIIAGEKDKSELGVTAVDDYTLEVSLNVPVSYFLSLMYFPTFYPVNEEFFTSCGDTFGTSPETTLSNGAFVLDSYEPAATAFHLTKNADYYDASRVQLSGLNYQVIQDSQTALMSYQNGDLDITLVNGDQVEQVSVDPEFQTIGAGYLWYVTPNISAVKELDNLNIRLALSNAINRVDVTSQLNDGSLPTYTAVPRDFSADFSADQDKFKSVCADDADAAAKYWEEGLKELGTDSITLEMVVDDDDAPKKVATVLKSEWEAALPGLTVEIVTEPKKQRVQDLQEGNYELGLTRWGPDYDDPMTYLGMWVTDCSNNYGLWTNPEYDSIIAECTTGDLCTELDARRTRLYDAEQIVMEEAVIFPIYTAANATLVKSNVTGIDFHPVALNRVFKDTVKQ
ncbi:oligopeptide transport system substrate-binding protein [Pseudobutyrivibrio sp. ACV-2]|uniref:peptide ABC transporter substrate-binding protein n=1 Tax=Pseudobutyrivibrio sp. ACV-2 TaxID=1520801 RepID=UPI000898D7EF|nr:peptide ABC transporter substrate-binding protein [Pseudobutyrivibrio sp. ACV-2]SEA40786.1 oligopeptide transport system substrate-binding protein [Pseudobutyrivibrio sp. ACV-2]